MTTTAKCPCGAELRTEPTTQPGGQTNAYILQQKFLSAHAGHTMPTPSPTIIACPLGHYELRTLCDPEAAVHHGTLETISTELADALVDAGWTPPSKDPGPADPGPQVGEEATIALEEPGARFARTTDVGDQLVLILEGRYVDAEVIKQPTPLPSRYMQVRITCVDHPDATSEGRTAVRYATPPEQTHP